MTKKQKVIGTYFGEYLFIDAIESIRIKVDRPNKEGLYSGTVCALAKSGKEYTIDALENLPDEKRLKESLETILRWIVEDDLSD